MTGKSRELNTILIPGNPYHATVSVVAFEGEYALVAGKETRSGKVIHKWCYAQTKDMEPALVPIPMKVVLGHKAQAPAILRQMAAAIEADSGR